MNKSCARTKLTENKISDIISKIRKRRKRKMLKIGLIGCGFMGTMHANCYKALSGVQVVAVADLQRDKAEALAKLSDAKIYSTGMELIEKEEVDAIDICLPTYMHATHAEAAMRKVKNVFVEKPVTFTVKEGEHLLKVQRETGAGVQVGQVIRFWDEYVWLKELIDSGKYGKVVNAMFRRLSPRPDGWEHWFRDASKSGGAALDLHIHDVDYMLYAFGKPKTFNSVVAHGGERNSYVSAVADYGDKVVTLEGSWDFPAEFPFEMFFRVKFENAVVEYSNSGLKLYTGGGVEDVKIEKSFTASVEGAGNISDLGGYYNELKYFTDCLKAGKHPEKAGLADAVESVRFVRKEID